VHPGERDKGQNLGLGVGHQRAGLWEAGGELVSGLGQCAVKGFGIGLGGNGL